MVRFVASYILALTAASTVLAAQLPDGVYRIIYTPPQTEDAVDSPPHYLTLASSKVNATFSPIPMRGAREKAQWVCISVLTLRNI